MFLEAHPAPRLYRTHGNLQSYSAGDLDAEAFAVGVMDRGVRVHHRRDCVFVDGWRTMGICSENLVRSLWAVALAGAVALLSVTVAARLHTLRLPTSPLLFIRHYGWYAVWAGLQQ